MTTKGVDSVMASDQSLDAALALAKRIEGVVCVSGETDYIIDAHGQVALLRNGDVDDQSDGRGLLGDGAHWRIRGGSIRCVACNHGGDSLLGRGRGSRGGANAHGRGCGYVCDETIGCHSQFGWKQTFIAAFEYFF